MAQAINSSVGMTSVERESASTPSYQAYQILRTGFTVAPIVAGLDKFFHLLGELGSVSPGFRQQPDWRSRARADAGCRRDRDRCGTRSRVQTAPFRIRRISVAAADRGQPAHDPRLLRRGATETLVSHLAPWH